MDNVTAQDIENHNRAIYEDGIGRKATDAEWEAEKDRRRAEQKRFERDRRLGEANTISVELASLSELRATLYSAHTSIPGPGLDKGKENFFESQLLEDINSRTQELHRKLRRLG